MHEQKFTPSPIEERMRAALALLIAASPTATEQTICRNIRNGGHLGNGFDFTASIENDYGFGATLDEAVNEAISKYGTVESRRSESVKRLQNEAAALGLTVIDPDSKPLAMSEVLAD